MADDHLGDHRHDFLEDLAALLDEQLVRRRRPSGAVRLRKPKLLRMLLENFGLEARAENVPAAGSGSSARSTIKAVATSPKMKWLSRSRKFRWPEQISGFDHQRRIGRARRDVSAAVLIAKVADEQATFMSKPKPSMPSACLDLDRHGRIGALHVGGRAEHAVDPLARLAPGARALVARRRSRPSRPGSRSARSAAPEYRGRITRDRGCPTSSTT